MPKAKSGKKNQSAPAGLNNVSIPGPSCPLVPRTRGPQASRDPRNDGRFWRPASTAVKLYFTPVYRQWLDSLPDSYKPEYGMERLDAKIEESVGNSLLVAGPLVDFYLSKIGGEVATRLRRNNGTGIATFERDVPPTVFSPLMLLIKRYGGKVDMAGSSTSRSGMYGTVEINVDSFEVLRSIFSGARSDGRTFLVKMHFDRERTPEDRVISHYRGKSVVVATTARPFRLHYSSSRGRLTVTFFRQKYDRNGLAEDTMLRAAQDMPPTE
ncbi:uncharacterized protein LOC118410885 [Branchiostoma floridae]|uniref:Uncharacterized protein LOC118410885 n=1 Tax=Branchiostoma floridae TaxID=7739 RepID=A0A9J7MJ33_BRAFL|nr:uncharacterized protein LOC118410885 [Branchiostoma floridae]